MRGSLSGVAARNPVQQRTAAIFPKAGRYWQARATMPATILWSIELWSAQYCRDEPIRIWPVARGCTLNAKESLVMEWALFRYPSSTSWRSEERRVGKEGNGGGRACG